MVYNFSASNAMLDADVLEKVKDGMNNYQGAGVCVLELAAGSKAYQELYNRAEQSIRSLMNIPQNFKILFLSGGKEVQFSAIPINMFSGRKFADYVLTGMNSKSASIEAKKYGDVAIAASSAGATPTFSTVPEVKRSDIRPDADYVYICFNNAIHGTKFTYIPDTGSVPLVADMSSFLLTEPVDMSKFALVYASADESIGVSGITVVILREDFVSGAPHETPAHLNYKRIIADRDVYNAPNAFSLFLLNAVLDKFTEMGGLVEIKRRNERKASRFYDYLDRQSFYTVPVDKKCRSLTNVIFTTGVDALDKKFCKEADAIGLKNLEGSHSVGGMRASLYNSMPMEGVEKLIAFMETFAHENPKFFG